MKTFATLSLLSLLFITGCATRSTIASRRQVHLAAYDALPPEMKAAVDAGQLKYAMTMEAVEIAWGKPSQVTSSGSATGENIIWVYQGSYIQESSVWGYYRIHYAYTPVTYVRAQVIFENGVVKSWQSFPAPLGY